MQKIFDIYTLKFVKKTDKIEEIKDGYSSALLYKVTRGENKFFLKIFNGLLNIKEIQNFLSIYQKLHIHSPNIIDFGTIEHLNKNYIVYHFIEGEDLAKHTRDEKYNLEDIRKFGVMAGRELLKLKAYKEYNKNLFPSIDINKLTQNTISNFDISLTNEPYQSKILNYFSLKEITNLKNQFFEYANLFKNIEPSLIHGDIKRANIIITPSKDLYIVDIESMQNSYDVLNFRYTITGNLFENNEKEAAFMKGYFDAIYSNSRPLNFNYMIIFTIILNFFTESCYLNITNLERYFRKSKYLFDKIDKMNLDTQFII